jgi:phosphoribosyl 1,2-cyclic phosphate phosphodiesterase
MPMSEGIACARKLKPGRTLFTHVGHRIGTHAELEAWVPEGFGVAYDGLEIELG